MDDELKKQIEFLKIQDLREQWPKYIAKAEKEKMGHENFLSYVISESYAARIAYSKKMRLIRASIPEVLIMSTYPFELQPNLSRQKILNIYDSLDYMKKHQNIIILGPTGCGKTGIGTSYLVNALEQNYTAYFISFPELIGRLLKSVATHQEDKILKNLASYDCLHIDELGYVDIETVQTGLFFRLMSLRHKRKSTIITSNLGFSEWPSFLKNDRLTAALIDRLTENSHVINMKNCTSIRPKGIVETKESETSAEKKTTHPKKPQAKK